MTVEIKLRRGTDTQCLSVRKGLGLQAVCARYSTGIEFDCRKADCGICAVKVISGADQLTPKTPAEDDFLKAMRADDDERLACQVRVLGDVELLADYL
jgi:ferredoxin